MVIFSSLYRGSGGGGDGWSLYKETFGEQELNLNIKAIWRTRELVQKNCRRKWVDSGLITTMDGVLLLLRLCYAFIQYLLLIVQVHTMHISRLDSLNDMAFIVSLQETHCCHPGCGCHVIDSRSSCTKKQTQASIQTTPNKLWIHSGESQSRQLSPLPLWIWSLEPFQVQLLCKSIQLHIWTQVCAWEHQESSLHQMHSTAINREPHQGCL